MNKLILLIGTVAILFLGVIYFQPIKLDEKDIVAENKEYNQQIESMGLDEELMLNDQKKIIVDKKLTFLKSFEEINYISQSANQPNIMFSRHWGNYGYLDYDAEPKIHFKGYLFMDEGGQFSLMVNYEYQSMIIDEKQQTNEDYFELRYSKFYRIKEVTDFVYFKYQDSEYLTYANNTHNTSENKFSIPKLSFSQYFKHPTVSGFYFIELEKEEGNQSKVFEMIIDKYEVNKKEQDNIVLGFNSFRLPPSDAKFIPSSIKVTYIKESE